jgi:hypothetical protein
MATNDFTATNTAGVTYALTFVPSTLDLDDTYNLAITFPDGGGTSETITGIPSGNVLTSDGTLNVSTALAGQNFVIPPTVAGIINIDVSLLDLTTSTIFVGGAATINAEASIGGNLTIDVDGGAATLANSAVASALSGVIVNLDNGGTFSNGAGALNALNNSTINFGLNGGTFIANADGASIDLSSVTINGFSNAKDNIEFQDLSAPLDHFSITTSGSSQTIELFSASNTDLGSVTVAGVALPVGTFGQGESSPLTFIGVGTTTVIIDVGTSVLCFLSGTRIATPNGEVAIEDFEIGDTVLTIDGSTQRVTFIGQRRLDLTRHPRPHTVYPVRILAGALADGVPRRDLLVSPDHALYLQGVLVPAKDLVDGVLIKQDSSFKSVHYYHLELEGHDVLIANGAGAESFLDVGHRGMFENSGEPVILHPDLMQERRETDSCAMLVTGGEQLAEIRRGLRERVHTYGFDVADDVRIELKIGGCVLKPTGHEDGRTIFAIPAGAASAVLSSPVFVPAEIDPASGDRRTLGVAIAEVMLDDGQVPLEAIFYAEDLHPRAANETASWTRGDVRLALPPEVGTISLRIVGWPRGWQAIQRAA